MFYRLDGLAKRNRVSVDEIKEWCKENLKDDEILIGGISIFISSEIDATAFRLRWE